MRTNLPEKPKPFTDALVEDICSLCKIVGDCERAHLNQEVDKLKFGLKRFAGSDNDIWFYTGFPNYNTIISFYNFFLPAATQLNYWGSDNAVNQEEKHGPQRKVQPIDELFMLLYWLRCDPLEKDLADRLGIS